MKWFLQGRTSSKWTSQQFEIRSITLFTNNYILRQVMVWTISVDDHFQVLAIFISLFLILFVRKAYCLCCQSISSIYTLSSPRLHLLLLSFHSWFSCSPNSFAFPEIQLNSFPHQGVWTGCYQGQDWCSSRCYHDSNPVFLQDFTEMSPSQRGCPF